MLDSQTTPEADSVAVLEQAAVFYQQQLDNYPRHSAISTGVDCMIAP